MPNQYDVDEVHCYFPFTRGPLYPAMIEEHVLELRRSHDHDDTSAKRSMGYYHIDANTKAKIYWTNFPFRRGSMLQSSYLDTLPKADIRGDTNRWHVDHRPKQSSWHSPKFQHGSEDETSKKKDKANVKEITASPVRLWPTPRSSFMTLGGKSQ